MKILVSACLLGVCCRYDGQAKPHEGALSLLGRHTLIPVCPEQAGGLATPRPAAERQGKRVVNSEGLDVTAQYRRGAEAALYWAKLFHCTKAILKEKSPSCGHGQIYDGTFSRTLTAGDGVAAELLRAAGIEIIGERDLL